MALAHDAALLACAASQREAAGHVGFQLPPYQHESREEQLRVAGAKRPDVVAIQAPLAANRGLRETIMDLSPIPI